METCRHCGQPLILKDGVCFFCQKAPGEEPMNRGKESPIGKAPLAAESAEIPEVKERRPVHGDSKRDLRWGKATQIVLLIILFAEVILAGIAEFAISVGWGFTAVLLVSAPCVGMAVEMISMSNEGLFEYDKKGWRLFHEYYHFPIKMITVALGFVILLLMQNFWTIVLELLLGLTIVLIDTHLEELFE